MSNSEEIVVVVILMSAITTAISVINLYMFFSCFLKPRKNKLYLLIYLVYIIGLGVDLGGLPTPLNNIIRSIILIILIATVRFEGRLVWKIALSGVMYVLWALSELLVALFLFAFGWEFQFGSSFGALLSQLLSLLVIFYYYNFFGIYRVRNLPAKYNIVLFLLPISSIFILYKLFIYGMESESSFATEEAILCLLIMLAINILIFKLYLSLAGEMSTRTYNAIYAQQLELYGKIVREREMSMAEYHRIRHDMKQHYSLVLNMLEKKNYSTAEEYLKQLVEDNTDHSQICRTENPVVDAIVNTKYSFMKTLGIECTADIHIPMQLPFEMADMSVLLGNILDNAIEANNNNVVDKYIKIYMKYDKNILIITVINSYDGTLLRDKAGNILTRKDDQTAHGFGLVSVERIVQKYHGSMVIEETSEEFKIKLIMVEMADHERRIP